ncbi:MAG: translesion DNA synthesis-associated protein ImuA [Rhodocyclaceae bacterium]|nr:translesion DNA synthesis-associated protein ImuA [Rhodocyclaceae bacterium]
MGAAGRPGPAGAAARGGVWRADGPMPPGVPTGHAALDAELPDGGWPRGGLVELLPARRGLGELGLLMPALARISGREMAWVVCVAPPLPLHAPAWAAAGVALSRLLVTRAAGGDAARSCARALDADGVGAIVAWLPAADAAALGRLQALAEKRRTLVFLFRPAGLVGESSPAPLRIAIDAGVAGRLSLRLLKRRGGARAEPLALAVDRPADAPSFAAAAAGAPSAAAAARSLSEAAAFSA